MSPLISPSSIFITVFFNGIIRKFRFNFDHYKNIVAVLFYIIGKLCLPCQLNWTRLSGDYSRHFSPEIDKIFKMLRIFNKRQLKNGIVPFVYFCYFVFIQTVCLTYERTDPFFKSAPNLIPNIEYLTEEKGRCPEFLLQSLLLYPPGSKTCWNMYNKKQIQEIFLTSHTCFYFPYFIKVFQLLQQYRNQVRSLFFYFKFFFEHPL